MINGRISPSPPRAWRAPLWAALMLALVWSWDNAAAQSLVLTPQSKDVPPGGLVALDYTLSRNGQNAASLVVRLQYPQAAFSIERVSPGAAAAGKSLDYLAREGLLVVALYGGISTLPDGPAFSILLRVSEAATPGATLNLGDQGSDAASVDAAPLLVTVAPGQVGVLVNSGHHTADTSRDWRISLSELLRVVQFHNVGALHCQEGTEDGYAPGSGEQGCAPHDIDYAPVDWQIDLSETMRLIQLYNQPSQTYHFVDGGEDGFAPGPF